MTDAFRPALFLSILAHLAGVWLVPTHFLRIAGQRGERERISVVGVVELPTPEPSVNPSRPRPLLPIVPELVGVECPEPMAVRLPRPTPRPAAFRRQAARSAPGPQPRTHADLARKGPSDYRVALPVSGCVANVKQVVAADLAERLREEELRAAARDYRPPQPPRQRPGSNHPLRRSNPDSRSRYLASVLRRLQRAKYFPHRARSRGICGTTEVEFVIRADGRLARVALARSSGFHVLDHAAKRIVERANPFDPLPGDLGVQELRVVVPVAFRLEEAERRVVGR